MTEIETLTARGQGKTTVLKCNYRNLVDPDFVVMRKTIDEMEEDIKRRGCEGKAHTFFGFKIDEETQKMHVKVMWIERRAEKE